MTRINVRRHPLSLARYAVLTAVFVLAIALSHAAPANAHASNSTVTRHAVQIPPPIKEPSMRFVKIINQKVVTALYIDSSDGVLFRSTDGARTWESIGALPTAGLDATGMVWLSPTVGILAIHGHGLYRTIDGGKTWTQVDAGTGWRAVAMHDGMRGYVVGDSASMKKTVDGGATWSTVTIGGIGTTNLNAVWCAQGSSTIAYACGDMYSGAGVIVKTTDGATWSAQASGVASDLHTISGYGAGTKAVALGQRLYMGYGVYTANGGSTWTASTGFSVMLEYRYITTAVWTSSTGVYVQTYKGLYKSTDSGATWSASGQEGGYDMTFVSEMHGWYWTGSRIWETCDRGLNWLSCPRPSASSINAMAAVTGYLQTGRSRILRCIDTMTAKQRGVFLRRQEPYCSNLQWSDALPGGPGSCSFDYHDPRTERQRHTGKGRS